MAPDLAAKAPTRTEAAALDQLLALTGPRLQPDWVALAFGSRYGGRFKPPGVFGALFAALTAHAALCEAAFNWTKACAQSADRQPPGSRLVLQVLGLKLTGAFRDVRRGHWALHDPDSHSAAQAFGFQAQSAGWDGIVYRSVRARPRGTCVVLFRRAAIAACVARGEVVLGWDGERFAVPSTERRGVGRKAIG